MTRTYKTTRINSLKQIDNDQDFYKWNRKELYLKAHFNNSTIWVSMYSYCTEIFAVEMHIPTQKAYLHLWQPYKYSRTTTRHTNLILRLLGRGDIADAYAQETITEDRPIFDMDFDELIVTFNKLYDKWLNENP